MSELALVVDDSNVEFDALRGVIDFVESPPEDARPLGAQSRLVASNSCILFVAAAFEESVRQLGRAYARGLAAKPAIPADRLRSIMMGLWEKASKELSGKPFGTRTFDEVLARTNIQILQDFCLDLKNVELMVDAAVHHSRNLRVEEVNGLSKRLGVTEICAKAGRSIEYRAFFLAPSVARAQSEFATFLNNFYDVRNTATHNLGVFRAMGAVDVRRYIDFFRLAVQRFSIVLEGDLNSIPD